MRILSLATVSALSLGALLCASYAPNADARGGGGGGFGGGGMGGGFGGGVGGGFGGKGGQNNPFGQNGMSGAAMKHLFAKRSSQGEQALAELADRKNVIAERRQRLADADRAANQEVRLAAERLRAIGDRAGDDIR